MVSWGSVGCVWIKISPRKTRILEGTSSVSIAAFSLGPFPWLQERTCFQKSYFCSTQEAANAPVWTFSVKIGGFPRLKPHRFHQTQFVQMKGQYSVNCYILLWVDRKINTRSEMKTENDPKVYFFNFKIVKSNFNFLSASQNNTNFGGVLQKYHQIRQNKFYFVLSLNSEFSFVEVSSILWDAILIPRSWK